MHIFQLPPLHSEWGAGIDEVFWLSTYLTGIAFLAVCAILFGCCILYRERPGHQAAYFHGNSKLHLAVTGALSALVFLGLDYQLESRGRRVMEAYKQGFATAEAGVRVQVRGQQFKWYFRYHGPDGKFGTPDDFVTTNFVVPVDVPVAVQIQSKDVIHSFYLPFQRIKQDAVPGITTTAWFQATMTSPGGIDAAGEVDGESFEVGCAELCGSGHTNMRNPFYVVTMDQFRRWQQRRHQEEIEEEFFNMGEDEIDTDVFRNWGWPWEVRSQPLGGRAPRAGSQGEESH